MQTAAAKHEIISSELLAPGIFSFRVAYPETDTLAPGQFVTVLCGAHTLRRPISVCETGRDWIRLVFEVRGEGTRWMSQRAAGDMLDILGPLGCGFTQLCEPEKAVFVGGGIGVPPLLGAASAFGRGGTAVLGFRSAGAAILTKDFAALGCTVALATEDGSAGEKGFVTSPLRRRLASSPCGGIYACGPAPMLRAVAKEAALRGVPCLVSLEERMACGVGACLGCAVRIKTDAGIKNLRVCCDGPVFDAGSVAW